MSDKNEIVPDMTIYKGKPSPEGRLSRETAVYELLEKLNIPYERLDHEAVASIEACQGVDKILDIKLCKNLFLCNAQRTKFYLLLMPGEKKFSTKEVCRQIQSARLSFAPEQYMEKLLNISPGAVSVMGLMNDKDNEVRLLIDREVLESEYLGCHPCVNTTSLKLKTADVISRFLPYTGHDYTVVELTDDES